MTADPASFRDPAGQVHVLDGRVFRVVTPAALGDFQFAMSDPRFRRFVDEGAVVSSREVDAPDADIPVPDGGKVYEHPRVPFISYPYEWSFSLLKRAALHHLDLQIALLPGGISLSDATAYNVQFFGSRPVFIDALSFRRYEEGEYWTAHRQFCEQFLNPLLMHSLLGVPHNGWFRGALEGIPTQEFARLVPWSKRLSWRLLAHVLLPAQMQKRSSAQQAKAAMEKPLPRSAYLGMLHQLRAWIAGLSPKGSEKTVWGDYADNNSYGDAEFEAKRRVVGAFVGVAKPKMLWDLGCNTGVYSQLALENGAEAVVGFDADHGALEKACLRATAESLNFLPLYQDAANPSPNQGWASQERTGLAGRSGGADALVALAFVHHLAIGRNIPLDRFVSWLVSLAPRGVVEFVPKGDPMVKKLLALRKDIFPDYTLESFESLLARHARIVATETITDSGRTLLAFER